MMRRERESVPSVESYLLQLIDPTLQGREKAVKKRKIITISSDEEGEGNDTETM